ncbi:hypothetical protein PPYR_07038 [Photinus pyralis]|uniref:G-protein coupled receptors family 2 profile 2 domain-containing protein n=2 Tax=Photinus pyralis TaxID=7054 RepID=A0A5N4APM0_PHOPY|nr:parathyroid hormone/parathyroid hormone-related peptide receptor-like [Photinus pyralis]KAB0799158.1 hypothetical protein PPYR_07038 [Photinus pyralis]
MDHFLETKRKECYQNSSLDDGNFMPNETFCTLIFDGIMCWKATKGGTLSKQPCPYMGNSQDFATKKCESNGEWYFDTKLNRSWTNYSQCWALIDHETALVNFDSIENSTIYRKWVPILKHVTHSGYIISLIALISAMIIFFAIKKLQCPRNRLHMHLFASFIMRGFMSLLKDFIFVEGVAFKSDLVYNMDGILKYTKEHHNWICKALTSSRNYFIVANYTLILMEGIYLHNLIFLTLCSDKTKITFYYIFGWAFPLLFVIPWILMRIYHEDTFCWTTSTNKSYLILLHGPITLSVIVNFVLFIMIVRILLMKLNSIYIQHQRTKYRRLVKSTLTLIPLFGVPYVISLVMLYSTNLNPTTEVVWLFLDQTFVAFQGLFVALVYCLLNTEVHNEIKHRYNAIRDRQEHHRQSRERTISHTLQYPTVIVPLNEDIPMTNYSAKYI